MRKASTKAFLFILWTLGFLYRNGFEHVLLAVVPNHLDGVVAE